MREIKFRGKTLSGKWVYGDLVHLTNTQGIYDDNDFHMDDEGVEMCDKCYRESLQEEIMPNG